MITSVRRDLLLTLLRNVLVKCILSVQDWYFTLTTTAERFTEINIKYNHKDALPTPSGLSISGLLTWAILNSFRSHTVTATPHCHVTLCVCLLQHLGTWYFKAAVSHREADIQKFRVLDNIVFTMEERANDTLLLTGHMRM